MPEKPMRPETTRQPVDPMLDELDLPEGTTSGMRLRKKPRRGSG